MSAHASVLPCRLAVVVVLYLTVSWCVAQEPSPVAESAAEPQAPAAEAVAPAAPTPAGPKLVRNVFFDTDLRQALSDVSAQTGVMIIPTQDVQGSVSMDLKDVPLEDALRLLCLPGGYVFKRVEPDVYLVGSPDPASAAFLSLAEVQVVDLQYVNGDELKGRVPAPYDKFCKFDAIGNQVIVTAPRPVLDRVVELVQLLDQPLRQVMIEALVVETAASNLKDFYARGQGRFIGADPGSGLVAYTDVAHDLLINVLALVEKRQAETKANPSVVAQEGRQAKVEVSTEQYFTIVTGPVSYPYTTLQQIDATIGLEITPLIAEGTQEITMKLRPTVSDVTGEGANNLPIITKRSAETVVRVKDGQVIAIGGLLEELRMRQDRKIPILGDLPIVGPIFRSTSRSKTVREVVIFVVPHLLEPDGSFRGPRLLELANVRADNPTARRQIVSRQTRPQTAGAAGPREVSARGDRWTREARRPAPTDATGDATPSPTGSSTRRGLHFSE